MPVTIQEVTTKGDLKRFINFPFSLYRSHPYWIPPLLMDEHHTLSRAKNPAFDYCDAKYWLAYKDGKLAGRIAGIINRRYIEIWGNRYARFGWIDFIDDREVVAALLKTAEDWAKGQGMTGIHGPLGFTDMDHEGMLIDGFNELGTLAAIYNHPYYPVHLDALGYVKDADWVEFEVKVPAELPEKAERVEKIVMQKYGLRFLEMKNSKDLLPYAHELFEVLNEAFAPIYAFVPLTKKQIDLYVKQYFSFVKTDYVKIVLDKEGKIAGFVIAMPSLSRAMQKARGRLFPFGLIHLLLAMRKPKYIDLYLGAIRPDFQGKGADALLMTEINRSAIANGIISAETNIELEDNIGVQNHWKYYDARLHKRRRCYLKTW
jgi:ribosomal protein S18 acetylase RimI-like enzyme